LSNISDVLKWNARYFRSIHLGWAKNSGFAAERKGPSMYLKTSIKGRWIVFLTLLVLFIVTSSIEAHAQLTQRLGLVATKAPIVAMKDKPALVEAYCLDADRADPNAGASLRPLTDGKIEVKFEGENEWTDLKSELNSGRSRVKVIRGSKEDGTGYSIKFLALKESFKLRVSPNAVLSENEESVNDLRRELNVLGTNEIGAAWSKEIQDEIWFFKHLKMLGLDRIVEDHTSAETRQGAFRSYAKYLYGSDTGVTKSAILQSLNQEMNSIETMKMYLEQRRLMDETYRDVIDSNLRTYSLGMDAFPGLVDERSLFRNFFGRAELLKFEGEGLTRLHGDPAIRESEALLKRVINDLPRQSGDAVFVFAHAFADGMVTGNGKLTIFVDGSTLDLNFAPDGTLTGQSKIALRETLNRAKSSRNTDAIMIVTGQLERGFGLKKPRDSTLRSFGWSRFAQLIEDNAGNARIFVDDPSRMALRNARSVPTMISASELAYFEPDEDDPVVGEVKNLKKLETAGFRVVTPRNPIQPGEKLSGVVMITGHKSLNLTKHVLNLGIRNIFRDQIVFFVSCGDQLPSELATKMIHEFGARSVLVFDGEVQCAASTLVVEQMADLLKSKKSYDPLKLFDDARSLAHLGLEAELQRVKKLRNMKQRTDAIENINSVLGGLKNMPRPWPRVSILGKCNLENGLPGSKCVMDSHG
jgi:hypothetical protein